MSERYTVIKQIEFCYGHRLLDYEGPCQHLHGHNGRVEVVLAASRLDRRGMVADFSEIKRTIKNWIDAELDHRMLLCRRDPLVAVLAAQQEKFYVMDANPTAENIARLIFDHARACGLPVVEVRLWETSSSCATYRPDRRS